jgi:hypothetical protein
MQRPIGLDLPTGVFMLEKGVLADLRETRRRGRRILTAALTGVVVGMTGLLGFAFGSGPMRGLGFLTVPIGFGVALGIGLQGANATYWSDVALIAYFAKRSSAGDGANSPPELADYEVYVTLGRAQTQDWFSKIGSGRFIRALFPASGEDSTRALVRNAVTAT